MGRHKLYIELDVRDIPVRTKDVIFKVYRDDKKAGELRLSQGAVVWRGANDKLGRRLRWKKFDELMQEHGRRAEFRAPGARKTVRKKKRI